MKPSGNDVFLTTSQSLAPGAEGSEYAIYDARVDGGFPEVAKPTACSEEDCRGPLTPTPLLGAPSSQTFSGAGNVGGRGSNPSTVPVAAPPKVLTRAQKLAKALKACKQDKRKSKRVACEKQARRRYRPPYKARGGGKR
jgi:hypothetical protein